MMWLPSHCGKNGHSHDTKRVAGSLSRREECCRVTLTTWRECCRVTLTPWEEFWSLSHTEKSCWSLSHHGKSTGHFYTMGRVLDTLTQWEE